MRRSLSLWPQILQMWRKIGRNTLTIPKLVHCRKYLSVGEKDILSLKLGAFLLWADSRMPQMRATRGQQISSSTMEIEGEDCWDKKYSKWRDKTELTASAEKSQRIDCQNMFILAYFCIFRHICINSNFTGTRRHNLDTDWESAKHDSHNHDLSSDQLQLEYSFVILTQNALPLEN